VPRRLIYEEGGDFTRADDLWVFASARGIVQRLDINIIDIKIITNPDDTVNPPNIVQVPFNGNGFQLLRSVVGIGRKVVSVSHKGMTAEYSIEIENLLGTDPGDGDNGGGMGGFIKWE